MLPHLALLKEEKGLQSRDYVYLTKEGKCISGKKKAGLQEQLRNGFSGKGSVSVGE